MHILTGLGFTMQTQTAVKPSWFCLSRAGITGVCHCALCLQYFKKYLIFKIMYVCVWRGQSLRRPEEEIGAPEVTGSCQWPDASLGN